MKHTTLPNKVWAAGIAAALALFVAIGLFVTIGTTAPSTDKALSPAALPQSVIAPAEQLGRAFAAVAARIKPAVVSVYSERMLSVQRQELPFPFGDDFFRQFFGQQLPQPQPPSGGQSQPYRVPERGLGSGMILDSEGRILTNYHVVRGVDEIKVQLADQRTFAAEIVGTDPKTDVAVIKIKGAVPSGLATVQLGDSDAIEDGDLVLAVGAPFGLTQTVTNGIISAKGRSDVGIADYEDFLQTDAPINPGNSGGPLVNMRGEVVGMNSAIATGGTLPGGEGQFGGVGFAIPVNMIKTMLPTLIKGGQIRRGMLGVIIQDVTEDLAKQFNLPSAAGALISQINKDSPAERAGLRSGDVIVRFDGQTITNTRQLRNLVAATAPGTEIKLGVIRNGKPDTVSVTIGTLPGEATAANPPRSGTDQLARIGLSVQTLTPALASQYDLRGDRGALITNVQDGSPGAVANLQVGDLIVQADHEPVRDVSDLQNVLARAKDQLLLLVTRKGTSLFVVVRLR